MTSVIEWEFPRAPELEAKMRASRLLVDVGNQDFVSPTGAAARLGLNRTTLNNRMRKLGITRPKANSQE